MSVFVNQIRWFDVLFNTKQYKAFVERQKQLQKERVQLEDENHQLRQANRDYVRKLLDRDQKLDECRNRIAVLSGAATENNLPYQVKGTHGAKQGPKSDVRSGDLASDLNRRAGRMVTPQPSDGHVSDNSALLTATAFAVVDSDFRAHVVEIPQVQATEGYPGSPSHAAQQCSPVYSAPEPTPSRSESYSPPSRNDSYDSPSSSSNDSSPGGCD
jgi:hypothetical protein